MDEDRIETESALRIGRVRWLIFIASFLLLVPSGTPAQAANGSVTGSVVQSDGTTAISGASVTIRDANWSFSQYTSTASDGTFTFSDLAPGSYFIDVWFSVTGEFPPALTSLTVSDGGTTNVGAITALAPNVFGKLTLPDGTTPVSGASVTIRSADWTFSRWTSTDSSGVFTQALTTNGTYLIEIDASHAEFSRPDTRTITFTGANVYADGTNGSTVIRLNNPAVRGSVRLADGTTPAQYSTVDLRDSAGSTVRSTSTDINGDFKLDAVDSGSYTLHVSAPYSPSGYIAADPISLTLTKGTTDTTYQATPVVLPLAKKTITGTIRRSDTGAVVSDANISIWTRNGNSSTSTTTDANGKYTLLVGTGDWYLSVWPTGATATTDWTYLKSPKKVSFTKGNDVAESATVDLTVSGFSVTLTGQVRLPDGTAPSLSDALSVNAWSDYGGGNWSSLDANGFFSMKLPAGTFSISISGSTSAYGTPTLAPVTLTENETYDLGVITMLARNATITGSVRDTTGRGLSGQSINAWKEGTTGGGDWGWATTDLNGNFSMPVTPGVWSLHAYPSGGTAGQSIVTVQSTSTSYVSTEPPQQVVATANQTTSGVDFTFEIADATITGTVQDSAGTILSSVWGWVDARKEGQTVSSSGFYYAGLGGSIQGGTFSLRVPAGTWNIGASLGYGDDYSTSGTKSVTVSAGETISGVVLTLLPNDATISGRFLDGDGNVLSDLFGSVFLDNGAGGHQWVLVENGTYSMKVSAGTWQFGCWVDFLTADQYFIENSCEASLTVAAKGSLTHDVVLKQADSTISGTVLDPNGNPLPNALISTDTSFGSVRSVTYGTYGAWFNREKFTDQNGAFTLTVPSGTYFVSASLPPALGYVNPQKEVVTVSPEEPGDVTLRFRKADATISGTVTQDGAATDAYVWAWSDEGGYAETEAATDGTYTLNVTGGETWNVGGADQDGTAGARSEEQSVEVASGGTTTVAIDVGAASTLPKPVVVTFSTDAQRKVSFDNGAEITFPANSITAQSATVTLTATPTTELPDSATGSLVDFGYDLEITRASGTNVGQPITQFVSDVTLCLPYSTATLTAAGLTASDLSAEYWDATAGVYRDVKTVVVEEAGTRVCLTTDHFSKFALVTAPVVVGAGETETPVVSPDVVTLKNRRLVAMTTGTGPTVYVYDASGDLVTSFQPYGASAKGRFRLIAANVIGDDTEELIVWERTGRDRHKVRVLALDGTLLGELGVGRRMRSNVTAVDLDGDGLVELVLSATNRRKVSIYQFASGTPTRVLSFTRAAKRRGGVVVLAANVTGDSTPELVFRSVGAGLAKITAYAIDLSAKQATRVGVVNSRLLSRKGVNTKLADLTGDGHDELIVWPKRGRGKLRVFQASKGRFTQVETILLKALRRSKRVHVATGDVTGNGKDDLVATVTRGGAVSAQLVSFVDGKLVSRAFIYPFGKKFRRGGQSLVGDFNADGTVEVLFSQRRGAKIKGYTFAPIAGRTAGKLSPFSSAYYGSKKTRVGYTLSATDLDADGQRELVVLPTSGSPSIRVLTFSATTGKLVVSQRLTPAGSAFRARFAVGAANVE